MSKPEDELEFINVVEHGAGSQSASLVGDGGGGQGSAGGGGGFAGGHLGFIRESRNKVTALFHYIFKISALFFYVMGGFKWVSSSSILTYIICILMLAFDFWTVKNVTGRLMVRGGFRAIIVHTSGCTYILRCIIYLRFSVCAFGSVLLSRTKRIYCVVFQGVRVVVVSHQIIR